MSVGQGFGPHQIKNYSSCPPIQIKKEIPHCHGLPAFLATRGARHDPLPVVVATDALQWGEDVAVDTASIIKLKLLT